MDPTSLSLPPPDSAGSAVPTAAFGSAIDVDAIPTELRAGKRFVGYRLEDRGGPKPAKMPYSPDAPKGASSSNPSHWTTFDQASRYVELAGLDGVMRAFDPADGLVGIDLDNCLDPTTGVLTDWAAKIVARLDTYAEISPSRTGVKLWAKGALPPHGRKRGDVEMYQDRRFFALTGQHLAGTPRTVAYRPDAIAALHREVFGATPDPTATARPERDGPIPALELGDEEVLRLASESPHNGERFARLVAGDSSDYAVDGNDGESEGDGALCEILAYYGGPDPDRIDRLFQRSARMRDKWQRADYRERTIALALRGKTRFYGDGLRPPTTGADGATACACGCCPHDDGPEVARLRRLALDRDDLIEAQRTIIATQRTRLDQEQALRTEDRRLRLAERELRRLKTFSGTQKDAVAAAAGIVASAASRGIEAPIITRAMVAEAIGCHESTAGPALKVFDLPGSPIARDTHYQRGDDGVPLQKKITTYAVATASPAEIIERMVAVGRDLEERPRRPGPRPCPKCPDADVIIRTITTCAGCGDVLEASPPRQATPDRSESRVSESPTPIVDVCRTYTEPLARIGQAPARSERLASIGPVASPNGNGNGHDQEASPFDQRAAELVAIPIAAERADGDYGRWAPTLEERAPRLQIGPKVDSEDLHATRSLVDGSEAPSDAPPPDLSLLAALAERRGWAPLATRHGTVGGTEAAWHRFLSLPPPWLPDALPAMLAGSEVAP